MTKQPAARLLLLSMRPLLLCLPAVWALAAAADVPPRLPTEVRRRRHPVPIRHRRSVRHQRRLRPQLQSCQRHLQAFQRAVRGDQHLHTRRQSLDEDEQCFDKGAGQMKQATWGGNFTFSPFRFSYEDNKILVIGCNTLAYITSEYVRFFLQAPHPLQIDTSIHIRSISYTYHLYIC